jgi:hypothetical protein
MPDPIQCTLDRSQAVPTFDCEPVEISSNRRADANQCSAEPNQSLPESEPPLEASAASVRQLVKNVSPELVTIPPASVPLVPFVVDGLARCPSQTWTLAWR